MRPCLLLVLAACTGKIPTTVVDTEPVDPDGEVIEDSDTVPPDPVDTDLPTETGCIQIDGVGAYARISDAVADAPEGATITICAGTYTEDVTVDRGLLLRGAGADDTTLVGELVFSAPDAGARGLAIDGRVELGADRTRLFEVELRGEVCVDASGAEIVLDTVLMENCELGLALVGDAEVRDSVVRGGVLGIAASGALTIAGLTLDGPADGLRVEEATLVAQNLSAIDVHQTAVLAIDSDVEITDSSFSGGEVAIELDQGELQLVESSLVDVRQTGLLIRGDASIHDVTITGDASVVAPASDPATYNRLDSTGLFFEGYGITIENSTIDGYNNAGMTLMGTDVGASAELTGVTVQGAGRVGALVTALNTIAVNLYIHETGTMEMPCDVREELGWHAGLVVEGGSFELDDSEVFDSRGVGMLGLGAAISTSDASFERNHCAGLVVDGGGLDSNISSYDDGRYGPFGGGLVCLEAESFRGNVDVFRGDPGRGLRSVEETQLGPDLVRVEEEGPVGLDLQLIGCEGVSMDTPQFSGGGRMILARRSSGRFASTLLEGAQGVGLTMEEGSDLFFEDLVVDGHVGQGILVRDSQLVVESLEILNAASDALTRTTFINGVFDSTRTVPAEGHGIEATNATVDLQFYTCEDAAGSAIVAEESTVTLAESTLGTPAEHGGVFTGSEVTITGGRAYGVRNGVMVVGGTLTADGFHVDGGRGHGLVMGEDSVSTLTDVTASEMGGYGLVCTNARTVTCAGVVSRDNDSGAALDCPASCSRP